MPRSRARRLAAVALAAVVATAVPAAAPPADADNVVVAINTRDGSTLFRSMLSIRRVMGDTVDEGNAAVAFASCEACETVAIALQVVLVMGDPNVVTPTNLALAINQGCVACETLASAYQSVLGTGGPVHFTADGNRRLAELRQDLLALRDQVEALTVFELQAEIELLTQELADIVETELVPAGPPVEGEPGATDEPDGASTTTTTAAGDDGGTTTTLEDDGTSTTTSTSTSTSTTSP